MASHGRLFSVLGESRESRSVRRKVLCGRLWFIGPQMVTFSNLAKKLVSPLLVKQQFTYIRLNSPRKRLSTVLWRERAVLLLATRGVGGSGPVLFSSSMPPTPVSPEMAIVHEKVMELVCGHEAFIFSKTFCPFCNKVC